MDSSESIDRHCYSDSTVPGLTPVHDKCVTLLYLFPAGFLVETSKRTDFVYVIMHKRTAEFVMRKNIWLPLIIIIVLWFTGIGGAYFALAHIDSSKSSILILEPDFKFYSDPAATHAIDKIKLPEITQGGVFTFTFYLKNTGTGSQIISAANISVPASTGTLTLTFDGQTQKTLAVNSIVRVDGILAVTGQMTESNTVFTLSINANPATAAVTTTATTLPPGTTTTTITTSSPTKTTTTATTTTLPVTTTTTTTTPAALNGQAIYNANCISCHRSPPLTANRTQAQLSVFISGHNTGRNLTNAQVNAIATFLKP
jgi:hypothetical protein